MNKRAWPVAEHRTNSDDTRIKGVCCRAGLHRGDHPVDQPQGRPDVNPPQPQGQNDQTVAVRQDHATIMTLFTLPLSSDSVGRVMS